MEDELELLLDEPRSAVFKGHSIVFVEWSYEGYLVLCWISKRRGSVLSQGTWAPSLEIINLPASMVIGFRAHKTTDDVYGLGLLNEGRPFVQWLVRVRGCCTQNAHGLTKGQFEPLIYLLKTPIQHRGHKLSALVRFLNGWRNLPGLLSDLYSPAVELTPNMFVMKREGDDDSSKQA